MNEIYCSCHSYSIYKQYQPISSKDVSMRATSILRRNVNCKRIDPFFDGAISGSRSSKTICSRKTHHSGRLARLQTQNGQIASPMLQVSWSCWTYLGVLVPSRVVGALQGTCEMVTNQRHVGHQTEQQCLAVSYNHHAIAQVENRFCIWFAKQDAWS